jgi:hypothetical protein
LSSVALTVLEATVTLYLADQNDNPIQSSPVWAGSCAENIRMGQKASVLNLLPSAAQFPRNVPLYFTHEITIERIWWQEAIAGTSLQDFTPSTGRYVLDIVWRDEVTGLWTRRTYYGVTFDSREIAGRELMESLDNQTFQAEQWFPGSGIGMVAPLGATMPATVRYVGPSGRSLPLYYYYGGGIYVAADASVVGGLATISASAAPGGEFTVTFAGQGSPALTVDSSGVTTCVEFIEGSPVATDVPRVDFLQGGVRIASITINGEFFAANITEGTPGSALFEILGGGSNAAAISASMTVFSSMTES